MHVPTDIHTVRRVNLWIGTAALVTGCLMAAEFGRTMSWLHAATLCLLSVAVAFLPAFVSHKWHEGKRPTAAVLGAIAAVFISVEYFSHLGYTVGHRIRDAEETTVQNVKYDGRQEQVKEAKASLALAEKRLTDLESQNAWAASVNAEALRARLASANLAIDLEAKRGGCKTECLKRTKERDTIASQIAITEERGELAKQIEATKRWIADSREKANNTEFRTSKIIAQTKFVSQLATATLEPGTEALTWSQIAIGAAIALVTTFLAPVCYFVAFSDRVPAPALRARVAQTVERATAAAAPAAQTIIRERVVEPAGPTVQTILDEALKRWAHSPAAQKVVTT